MTSRRFEVGTKICLSITAYHEESWQPAWGGMYDVLYFPLFKCTGLYCPALHYEVYCPVVY